MPRPKKWRTVCRMPRTCRFGPLDGPAQAEIVELTVDEYEAIRLIDLEGLTQEECAAQMGVARTTAQGIYAQARRKTADSLVNGKLLLIGGGDYRLCGSPGEFCGCGCRRRRMRAREEADGTNEEKPAE